MAHQSENVHKLKVVKSSKRLSEITPKSKNVELIILPYYFNLASIDKKELVYNELNSFIDKCSKGSTICILTSPLFASDYCSTISSDVTLKLWVAVKLKNPNDSGDYVQEKNCALLVLTKYKESLNHTKTRIAYSYCPSCDKTTKDYGGKKHLYHEYGTIMSDVWRDITVDFKSYPNEIIERLKDLFGLNEYSAINVHDQRKFYKNSNSKTVYKTFSKKENVYKKAPLLIKGDCIKELKKIPDNSIDFCFADPPYNLNKKYETWDDGIDIQKYFEWCDAWLTELGRILKPNRTVAILNIPQWCIRHFKHMIEELDYQDWIVWEGLSMPVRMIMPSHYSILCFSKGKPRKLPGISRKKNSEMETKALINLKEGYCARPSCIKNRKEQKIKDSEVISNVWFDIHRLKHNSRRVDHPCQLPPQFMHRLIAMFTNEGEIVLDPFNGVGTTSLSAQQLNRKYVGIELSEYYHQITSNRHKELSSGIDPFRKINDDSPKAKNSPVERLKKQKYEVSKKVLQLEVRKIAKELGHIPSKEEISQFSNYPIDYFENYFISWGEVTAAARTTGMTEDRRELVS